MSITDPNQQGNPGNVELEFSFILIPLKNSAAKPPLISTGSNLTQLITLRKAERKREWATTDAVALVPSRGESDFIQMGKNTYTPSPPMIECPVGVQPYVGQKPVLQNLRRGCLRDSHLSRHMNNHRAPAVAQLSLLLLDEQTWKS